MAASEQFERSEISRPAHHREPGEKQRIATAESDDVDVFGYHYENDMLAVNLFHMRGGKIVDRRDSLGRFTRASQSKTITRNAPDAAQCRRINRPRSSPRRSKLYIDQRTPRFILVRWTSPIATPVICLPSAPTPRRNRRTAAWRESARGSSAECEVSYDQRFRVLQPAEGDSGMLQDLLTLPELPRRIFDISHPGGDGRLHGRLGKRRDEEIRLPQVPGGR
jgi:excinuclease ABC subunit C